MGRALQHVPSFARAHDRLSLHAETGSVDHSAQSFSQPTPRSGKPTSLEPSPSQIAYENFLARVSDTAIEPCELRIRESPRRSDPNTVISHANAAYNLPPGFSRPQSSDDEADGDAARSDGCCSSNSDVWHEAHTVSTTHDSSNSAASVGGLLRPGMPSLLVDKTGMRTPAPALLVRRGSASTDISNTLEQHAAALRQPPKLLPTRLAAGRTHEWSSVRARPGDRAGAWSEVPRAETAAPRAAKRRSPSPGDAQREAAAAAAREHSNEDGSATIELDAPARPGGISAKGAAGAQPSSSAARSASTGAQEQPAPSRRRADRSSEDVAAPRTPPRRRSSGRGEPVDTDTSETLQLHMRQLPTRPRPCAREPAEVDRHGQLLHGQLRQLPMWQPPMWQPLAEEDEREHQIAELEASIRSALSDSMAPPAPSRPRASGAH